MALSAADLLALSETLFEQNLTEVLSNFGCFLNLARTSFQEKFPEAEADLRCRFEACALRLNRDVAAVHSDFFDRTVVVKRTDDASAWHTYQRLAAKAAERRHAALGLVLKAVNSALAALAIDLNSVVKNADIIIKTFVGAYGMSKQNFKTSAFLTDTGARPTQNRLSC
jgi:hypothetical protein